MFNSRLSLKSFSTWIKNYYKEMVKIIVNVGTRSFRAFLAFFIVTAHVCSAQTVPAGPVLWLQADTGIVQQNGHVAVWHDQSGHGNDVRMDDTLSRPDLIIDSGRPAMLFHGWNYLQGPPIFPDSADYTIAVVAKINNFGAINNLISGNVHALYFNNDSFPRVVHAWFQTQEISTVPVWTSGFSAITALYDQAYQQATLYVNGQYADSTYVQATPDTTLTIGSYNGGYFLQGEIEEILLYDRKLTPSEDSSLNTYLMERYDIAPSTSLPKPDSTFSSIPNPFQLYPRGGDDSATVSIAGTMYRSGFDSMYVLQFKNDLLFRRISQLLVYDSGHAPFVFSPRIHAELSEYRFEVHLVSGAFDSTIAVRDSIACGDAFLMDGQSNAFNGFIVDTFETEFSRSLGFRGSENVRDTLWLKSNGGVGAADERIQQDLVTITGMPSFSVNDALGGTAIEAHYRNDSDKYDLRTIYGRMLYKTTKSGMVGAVKVFYWLQGEGDSSDGYYQKFLKLSNSWKEDYPNLQKIYLLQMRPNYCGWGNITMRDVQRAMGDSIPSVEPIASAAMSDQTGCHYNDDGYRDMGDRFYLDLARDFYHATDTMNLRSANALGAWYSKPDHSQIAVLFSPPDAKLQATADTTVDGISATLKDYIYTNDKSVSVQSIAFDNDTLFVNLDKPSTAQSIQYLPDQYYNGSDSVIYQGPWIVNSRGFGALLWYDLPISNEPLSVNEPVNPNSDVEIIPNPASRAISIDASSLSGTIEATLVAETGAIVWQQTFLPDHTSSLVFDLSNESSGCYLLRLSNATTNIEKKFILER